MYLCIYIFIINALYLYKYKMNISNKIILCLALVTIQTKYLALKKRSVKEQSGNCTLSIQNTQNQIGMRNCGSLYAVTLGIGTPPQYFDLQFDTGSSLLWFPTVKSSPQGYNSSKSSTYHPTKLPGSIQYVDGSGASGFYGTELVTLTQTKINVTNQILFVEKQNGLFFPGDVIGIVGMGYTDIPNFLDLAYSAGQIKTSTFSLQLHGEDKDSVLYYDNIPEHILQNTTYCDRDGGIDFWQIKTIGVYADDTDLTSYAAQVSVIDSGTTLFYLNPSLYNQIVSLYLQGVCKYTDEQWICNCSIKDSLPKLTFMFSGVQVYLYPQDYVQTYTTDCVVQINQVDTSPAELLLGDTLFKKYIITFDKIKQQVGFNGELQPINSYGDNWFVISQYVMLITVMLLCFMGGCLLSFVRFIKVPTWTTQTREIMLRHKGT